MLKLLSGGSLFVWLLKLGFKLVEKKSDKRKYPKLSYLTACDMACAIWKKKEQNYKDKKNYKDEKQAN